MASKYKSTKTEEQDDAIDVESTEIVENPTFKENPLLQPNVISTSDEIEQKVATINNIESLAVLTKQELSLKKDRVALEVDNRKLDVAKKTIDSIDKIITAVANAETIERVTKNIKTPMDMKMMAEAAERLTGTLKNLMNPNSLDEFGTKKKQKINFMFKSSGPIEGAIQIDNSNDD